MKYFCSVVLVLALAVLGLPAPGHSLPITYIADLNGPSESPPNTSPATGFSRVIIDTAAHTLFVHVDFSGLLGTSTAAHIHSPTASPGTGTAGVATQVPTFVSFPLGVTSGSYEHTFDTALDPTWNPAYVIAQGGTALDAEAALAASLLNGTAYLNIHSSIFPSGEIRGFLTPVPVPATLIFFGSGLAGLAGSRCRRKKR